MMILRRGLGVVNVADRVIKKYGTTTKKQRRNTQASQKENPLPETQKVPLITRKQ